MIWCGILVVTPSDLLSWTGWKLNTPSLTKLSCAKSEVLIPNTIFDKSLLFHELSITVVVVLSSVMKIDSHPGLSFLFVPDLASNLGELLQSSISWSKRDHSYDHVPMGAWQSSRLTAK
ncbi:uncharacterized protein RHO25_013165 [Cercospora beticola]|uniref:Uncharacterized protein n=1 Tax=Cercospora beticola TaxID=122368 RepID=A0ABZ0P9A0_CERBT|nr:hypothetical protein RHO25_013165 [Cercospora beticola]